MIRNPILHVALTFSLGILGSSTCLAGKVYKWVDEDGVTHFTQYAPPNRNAELVNSNIPQAPVNDAQQNTGSSTEKPDTASNKSDVLEQFEALQKQLEQESDAKQEALKEQQLAAIKQENCKKGKANLAELLRSPRIRLKQKNGEVKLLTEAERQAKIDYARNTIKENCN